MQPFRSLLTTLALAVIVALSIHLVVEAVDVKAEFDKTFNFKTVRTWGWNPAGAGAVRMARTADDDPEAMKQRVDPLIRDAMTTEMTRLGLTHAASAPDLTVTYYLLLSTGASAQEMGQFLPATVDWGLPMFAPATQSLEFVNRGSLVLDLSAKDTIVWRGIAQAKIELRSTDKQREALLRESVRDLLKKYPK
jgi:hypothetical protein